MEKSQILLEYLKKYLEISEPIPTTEKEKFLFYCSAVNKLPGSAVTESFLKIEDAYLSEQIKRSDIIDVSKKETQLIAVKKEAAFFSADAVLSFVTQCKDKSVYVFGGTRLKTQVVKALAKENITVTKSNNLFYKGVISARLPEITQKLTSVILDEVIKTYKFALDSAESLNLKSMVLCVPSIQNSLIESRIATAVINEIKSHKAYNKVKIVIAVSDDNSFNTYQKQIQGGIL